MNPITKWRPQMNIHKLTVLAICFFTGLFLGATITARSQRQAQTVADLKVQKHDLSKMDWVLLDARVTALEATPLTEPSHVVSPVDFTYDETAKKIVARGFVDPEWLSKANAEQIKTMFTMRAIEKQVLFISVRRTSERSFNF